MRQKEISLRAHSPPQIRERALLRALSPVRASDKGDEAPVSLNETRSPSKDNKGVPSEPEHTDSLKLTTMHSHSESTFISPKADKLDGTKLSLDKRAEDKNEDEEGIEIPPPLFKNNPEDKDEGLWSRRFEPVTLAKIDAIKETTKKQKAVQEIIRHRRMDKAQAERPNRQMVRTKQSR